MTTPVQQIVGLTRSSVRVAIALSVALFASVALAQAPPQAAPTDAPSAAASSTPAPAASADSAAPSGPTEAQKTDAKVHFDKGITLFEEEAWDAALAEFTQSRALFPTRSATKDAGICLRKLHRFDEAVDMFEEMLKFPSLPAEERALADAQIKELSTFVGSVALHGVEAGAKILIDGRERGETPLPPLRVSAGTHVLRAAREGYAPFEVQITVAGGQAAAVNVTLAPLLQGGRLHVEEATGQSVEVLVDGAVVGKAPWEGMLPVGDHVVILRGEGNLGAQPSLATVRLNAQTQLSLRAEPLPATLRVQPTPAGATVILDGVPLGRGAWTGHVRQGSHVVEVHADGYLIDTQRVLSPADKETAVDVQLRKAESTAPSGRAFVEADGAPAFGGSFGGPLVSGCGKSCSRSGLTGFSVLGHGGYELPSGLGFLIDAGFLSLKSSINNRTVALQPAGFAANMGTAADKLTLSGLLVGASAQFHKGEKYPLTLRLGAGMLLGTMNDARSGNASTNARPDPNSMPPGAIIPAQPYSFNVSESTAARSFYLAPELRGGVRLAHRVELTLGVRTLILVGVTVPRWADQNPFNPGQTYRVGSLYFGKQDLTGGVIFVVVPSAAVRFDF